MSTAGSRPRVIAAPTGNELATMIEARSIRPCTAHNGRILHELNLSPDCRQCLMHRAYVARAVVNQRDHSTPLVDGIAVPLRGSIRTAASNARPNALKSASALW